MVVKGSEKGAPSFYEFFEKLYNFVFREDRARRRLMEEVSDAWNKQIQVSVKTLLFEE